MADDTIKVMYAHIVGVQPDMGIGKDGELLHDCPEDKKFFYDMTRGKSGGPGNPVIMGRKTFESLPHRLKDRYTIVVGSRPPNTPFAPDFMASTLSDALARARQEALQRNAVVFIAGGERIYKETKDLVDYVFMTKFEENKPGADTFYCGVPEHLTEVPGMPGTYWRLPVYSEHGAH